MISIIKNDNFNSTEDGNIIFQNYAHLIKMLNINTFEHNNFTIIFNEKVLSNLVMYMCCSAPVNLSTALDIVHYLNDLTCISDSSIPSNIVNVNKIEEISTLKERIIGGEIGDCRKESNDTMEAIVEEKSLSLYEIIKHLNLNKTIRKYALLTSTLIICGVTGDIRILPTISSYFNEELSSSILNKEDRKDNFLAKLGNTLVPLGHVLLELGKYFK